MPGISTKLVQISGCRVGEYLHWYTTPGAEFLVESSKYRGISAKLVQSAEGRVGEDLVSNT